MLIINNGLLGDLLISSFILNNDKALTQNRKCYYLINKNYKELFEYYQGSINILYWDLNKYRKNFFYRIRYIQKIRGLKSGLAINIRFGRRIVEDELTYLSGAAKTAAFELNDCIIKLFSKSVDKKFTEVIKRKTGNDFNDLCLLIEELTSQSVIRETKLFPGKKERAAIKNFGSDIINNSKIIAISPFSSELIKNWSIKNYISLSESLSERLPDFLIVITGQTNQRKYLDERTTLPPRVMNCIGIFSLSEICLLISRASLFIGNDSGLFHIAKTYNIPRIGIIGGGSAGIIHPYGNTDNEILLYKNLPCLGCNWICPNKKPRCLTEVTQNEVLCAVKNLIQVN